MDLSAARRRLLTVTGVAGIGYTLSWIAGLSARKADAEVGVLS